MSKTMRGIEDEHYVTTLDDARIKADAAEMLDLLVETSICGICLRLRDRMYTATCGHSYCMHDAKLLLSGRFNDPKVFARPVVGLGQCPICRLKIACPTAECAGRRRPFLKHSITVWRKKKHTHTHTDKNPHQKTTNGLK